MERHDRGVTCPICKGQLVQRNPINLYFGAFFFLSVAIGILIVLTTYWIASLLFSILALYLLYWVVLKKGFWCRNCKRMP